MHRRNFLRGLAVSAIGLPVVPAAHAAGEALKLSVVSRTIEVNGKPAKVFGISSDSGAAPFGLTAGQTTAVDLTNTLDAPTMVHWHGLTPQWQHDGVPDLPLPMLQAGETRRYELPGGAGGTHWMHAHTLQEQNLLAAPLISRSPADAQKDEQEVVILLHDFSFTPAEQLLTKLKSGNAMSGMNMSGMNMGGAMPMDHTKHGMQMGGMKGMDAMPGMKMDHMMGGMDVNDIEYDAYLANDRTLRDPQVTQVEKAGKVRLRIINGATGTAFFIDTGMLDGTVLAVDGQDVAPVKGRRFPLAMGQRIDIALNIPSQGGAFPIFALREGAVERTGVILATPGAKVSRLAEKAVNTAATLSLDLEQRLRAASPLSARQPDQQFMLQMTGDMQTYSWNLASDAPLMVQPGARVAIEMHNMSMMTHPMHLHGHHFQVVAINGKRVAGAVRDTVLIPAMQSVEVAFDAINPGKAWPLHCHHLYHMASGMMTTVGYAGA